MKHVVFNFPFNERNLKAIDGDCLLALLFIYFFLNRMNSNGGNKLLNLSS